MRFCRIAAIIALFCLRPRSFASAAPEGLSPADRAVLADYARDTWRSIAALADRGRTAGRFVASHRGTDGSRDGLTSPTNIAAYLWSTLAAEDLRLITPDEAGAAARPRRWRPSARLERVARLLLQLVRPGTGQRARAWPGGGSRASVPLVGGQRLAGRRPDHDRQHPARIPGRGRGAARADGLRLLLRPLRPGRPRSSTPGLLRGGYWPDDGTFADFHYGMLNTEPRIASYIGIARGKLPPEHYYRMFRVAAPSRSRSRSGRRDSTPTSGCPVFEGTLTLPGDADRPELGRQRCSRR